MKNKITLNTEGLKGVFKQAFYDKLKARDGDFTHNNRDVYYTPARWYYTDDHADGGVILETQGNISTSKNDDSGQITVNVTLNFIKTPR